MTEEKKKSKNVELTQVITGTAPAFQLPNGEVVQLEEYLVWLGNNIVEIKKAIS